MGHPPRRAHPPLKLPAPSRRRPQPPPATLPTPVLRPGPPRSIASPSVFSHCRLVPSPIVSPSLGIWIFIVAPPISPCRQPVDGGLDVGDLREVCILQGWREGDRRVRRGEAYHRCVESLER